VLDRPLGSWLRRLRGTATFVQIAVLCLAGASLVIVFVPGSPGILHTLAPVFPGLPGGILVAVGAVTQPIGNLASALLGWLAVALIFAAFGQLIARGVAMRAELDTVI
jgi:hypothetical protein